MFSKKVFPFLVIVFMASLSFAIPPYYYFGELQSGDFNTIVKAITNNDFEVLGIYNPMEDENITVIAFTNKQLVEQTAKVKDRGLLAAILKIGVINDNGKPNIYLLNPEYIFWAYLRDEMKKSMIADPLMAIDIKIKNALELMGVSPVETGGNITRSDLVKYRYMLGMERFTDPVELNTFKSFEEGLKTIINNVNKGDTKIVYKLIDEENKTAIFGIGLMDKEIGEPHFLPIIGIANSAALPYEIILLGNKATMLHGRYRLALHWPELTMITFSKIMSTPGNIENQLKKLTIE